MGISFCFTIHCRDVYHGRSITFFPFEMSTSNLCNVISTKCQGLVPWEANMCFWVNTNGNADKELSIRCCHGATRAYCLHTTTLDPSPNASDHFYFSFTNCNHKFKPTTSRKVSTAELDGSTREWQMRSSQHIKESFQISSPSMNEGPRTLFAHHNTKLIRPL